MATVQMAASKVSKRAWYNLGGFTNSRCFRRQRKGRGWEYFYRHD